MTDRDNITLPREVVKLALEAFEAVMPFSTTQRELKIRAVEALRTHLAAPKQEQEPVAYFDLQKQVFYWSRPTMIDVPLTVALEPLPLYAAPSENNTHPGYVIGSHWLETAYSRICAGEAEADVLRDCGWERVDEALTATRDRQAAMLRRLEEREAELDAEIGRLRDELRQSSIDITRAEVERLREALDKSLTDEQIRQIAASIDRLMPIEPAKILFARRIEAALRREET